VGVKDYLSVAVWIIDEKCTGPNWEVKFNFKIGLLPQTGPEYFYGMFLCVYIYKYIYPNISQVLF